MALHKRHGKDAMLVAAIDRRALNLDLARLRIPPRKHAVGPDHWGGDANRTLNDPITEITLGVNDDPDSFVGRGAVYFGWLELLAAAARKGR